MSDIVFASTAVSIKRWIYLLNKLPRLESIKVSKQVFKHTSIKVLKQVFKHTSIKVLKQVFKHTSIKVLKQVFNFPVGSSANVNPKITGAILVLIL